MNYPNFAAFHDFLYTENVDPRLKGLIVSRDSKWVDETSGNLYILVKQVSTVRSHTSWRVRLGLVECAEHLLMHCARYFICSVLLYSLPHNPEF